MGIKGQGSISLVPQIHQPSIHLFFFLANDFPFNYLEHSIFEVLFLLNFAANAAVVICFALIWLKLGSAIGDFVFCFNNNDTWL